MMLSRALLRGSRVLGGANSLFFSTPKRLQTPSFSQFHSFVYTSPKKELSLQKDHVSLLSHLNLNFKAFQRFGISSSACPDPSGKENGQANESDLMSDDDIIELVEEIEEAIDAEVEDIKGVMDKVWRLKNFRKGKGFAKLEMEISQLVNAKGELLAEMIRMVDVLNRELNNSEKHGIQNFAEGQEDVTGKLVGMASTQVHEQLELVRELLSNIKSKSEELRLQLELKLEELQKEVDWLQQFRITSDDLDLNFPAIHTQFWLTVVALCIIWLSIYGN